MTTSIDNSIASINQSLKDIAAAQLLRDHPKLTPDLVRFLAVHSLTAAAAKGRIPMSDIDEALEKAKLPIRDRLALKLSLRHAQVI